jgi:hypothetical protein
MARAAATHEVMVRGTFANVRIRNLTVPSIEGSLTSHQRDPGEHLSIYDAAERYSVAGGAFGRDLSSSTAWSGVDLELDALPHPRQSGSCISSVVAVDATPYRSWSE